MEFKCNDCFHALSTLLQANAQNKRREKEKGRGREKLEHKGMGDTNTTVLHYSASKYKMDK